MLDVYTDSSFIDNTGFGIGILIIDELETENKYSSKFKFEENHVEIENEMVAREFITVDVAECFAIYSAMKKIKDKPAVIYTDSEQCFLKINGRTRCKNKYLIMLVEYCKEAMKDSNIELRWIKSHCGVYGNNIADRLASSATYKFRNQK